MEHSSNELEPVDRLAEEFLERQRKGERPTVDEYAKRYPELAEEILEVFPALLMVDQIAPADSDLEESRTTRRPVVLTTRKQIGDYRILQEIGRGGMGVVYEAEQQSLGRRVALKVLLHEMSANTRSMQRFQREARAAARMHHTNIVPVFEVGQEGGTAFYAMQLIQGQGLDFVIDDLKRLRQEHALRSGGQPPSPPGDDAAPGVAASLVSGKFYHENLAADMKVDGADSDNEPSLAFTKTVDHKSGSTALAALPGDSEISTAETDRCRFHRSVGQIGVQTADALSYAHARGIIHRDIKPSNLILDAGGVVWVTDFGLAKTDDEAMTHTGDILGTMRYMSPERFRGECDVRADIYSLGLTLYELLTLRPAFESPDRLKLIEMVRQSQPAEPRAIDPSIPRDVETIVLKAIDKDPKRRYQSSEELAEDLRRFIDDQPIKARPISLPERLIRWSRRNASVAASLAVVVSVLIAVAVGSTIAASHFRLAKEEEERQRRIAEEALIQVTKQQSVAEAHRRKAEYGNYVSRVRVAATDLDVDHIMAARRELLDTQPSYRNWEWGYLVGRAWPPPVDAKQLDRDTHVSDSEYWDAAPVQTIQNLDYGRHARIGAFQFSRDGTKFASGTVTYDDPIRLWDPRTGDHIGNLPRHGGVLMALAFSHDDRRLAAVEVGGDLVLFDIESRTAIWTRKAMSDQPIRGIWFTPDDRHLIVADGRGMVSVLEANSKRTVRMFTEHTMQVQSIQFLDSGSKVVSGSRDGAVWTWEFETGRPVQPGWAAPLKSGQRSSAIEISRGGTEVAVGYIDGSIVLWDRATGEGRNLFKGDGQIIDLVYSPDGSCLIAAEDERAFRVLDRTGKELASVATPMQKDAAIAMSYDGARIATCSTDGITRMWAPASLAVGRKTLSDAHDDAVLQAAFSWDGKRIVTASYDKRVRVWDTATQHLLAEFTEHKHELLKADFSPDGSLVISIDLRGTAHVWDSETGDPEFSVAADPEAFFAAATSEFGLRGEIMNFSAVFSSNPFFSKGLVANYGKDLAVFDHIEGRRIVSLEKSPTVGWPVIDPNGQRMALITATLDSVQVWDLKTGEKLHTLAGHERQAYFAEFSRDGLQLVTSSMDGTAILWDVVTGEEVASLDHGANVMTTRFSPCSEFIATASANSTARIWNASTGECISTLEGHTHRLTNVEFSPDGKRVLTTAMDNSLRVWDPNESNERELVQFTRDSKLLYGTWSPDGQRILTCWDDGSVHLLDAFPWGDADDDANIETRIRTWRAKQDAVLPQAS